MRLEALGQRSETVRRANLSSIVRDLHAGGPASRSELVARTGLTRSAIRALIGELAAADLAIEEPPEPQGTPGRPSPVVRSYHIRFVGIGSSMCDTRSASVAPARSSGCADGRPADTTR